MKIAIITTHGQESSRSLCEGMVAAGLNAHVYDLNRNIRVGGYEYVFSYGTSIDCKARRKRYNSPEAVRTCVDKVKTFKAFKRASVPTCEWTTDPKIAQEWDYVLCRTDASGRRNEGMSWWYKEDGKPIPKCELYSKNFDHVREYRVVVFMDQVAIYFKSTHRDKVVWDLNFVKPSQWGSTHENMGWYAVEAAKAIGIDYVGFDVLVNSKGQCCFLEANSSPILCEEIKDAIINHFVAQK